MPVGREEILLFMRRRSADGQIGFTTQEVAAHFALDAQTARDRLFALAGSGAIRLTRKPWGRARSHEWRVSRQAR